MIYIIKFAGKIILSQSEAETSDNALLPVRALCHCSFFTCAFITVVFISHLLKMIIFRRYPGNCFTPDFPLSLFRCSAITPRDCYFF